MAKGLCCRVQADGNLGKTITVDVHKKDGTVSQRCGVCEVRPSCHNPQKLVFSFRFLPGVDCGLLGGHCQPTAAGISQYNANRTEAAGHPVIHYNGTRANIGTVIHPAYSPAGYSLPSSSTAG